MQRFDPSYEWDTGPIMEPTEQGDWYYREDADAEIKRLREALEAVILAALEERDELRAKVATHEAGRQVLANEIKRLREALEEADRRFDPTAPEVAHRIIRAAVLLAEHDGAE